MSCCALLSFDLCSFLNSLFLGIPSTLPDLSSTDPWLEPVSVSIQLSHPESLKRNPWPSSPFTSVSLQIVRTSPSTSCGVNLCHRFFLLIHTVHLALHTKDFIQKRGYSTSPVIPTALPTNLRCHLRHWSC
jgi:hypothetical protein